MKKGFLLVVLIISCTSCASLFTGKQSKIQIHSNEAVDLVLFTDTIKCTDNKPVYINMTNSKQPLPLMVLDSTRQAFLPVSPHKPFTYWLNALPFFYFSGFLVDEITGLKWRYPRKIYIHADSDSIGFLPYLPMEASLIERKNKITFAPLSLAHGYHPAWEFGYERLHGASSATQISLGFLKSRNNEYARNSKGMKVSLEHKLFIRNEAKQRIYAALAVEYHHKDHDADLRFEIVGADGDLLFPRTFFRRMTTIEKRFISFTPRIGVQSYITPQLVLEGYFGAGLRARNVRHQNSNPAARHTGNWELDFFNNEYSSNREIKDISPNIDLNFRVAWVF